MLFQDYYYGIVSIRENEYKVVTYAAGNQHVGSLFTPQLSENIVEHINTDIVGVSDLSDIAQQIVAPYTKNSLSKQEEGFIIKTDECYDARYFLRINYIENRVTLKPSFLSQEVVSCTYDADMSSIDMFNTLHNQVLPKLEQYYRTHKRDTYEETSEEVLISRLEKLLQSNNRL